LEAGKPRSITSGGVLFSDTAGVVIGWRHSKLLGANVMKLTIVSTSKGLIAKYGDTTIGWVKSIQQDRVGDPITVVMMVQPASVAVEIDDLSSVADAEQEDPAWMYLCRMHRLKR